MTRAFPHAGLLAALAGFAALQVVAWLRAGVFEYPLDDVYIHLAMAENIAHGTYGVNAGEPASAASSILFPLLLTPFPGTELQRLLPLVWNTLAVAGCGWVFGRIVQQAGMSGAAGLGFAIAAPVLLNMSGVGFTGMEAAPHMLASLMIVLGLWRALNGQGAAAWLIAAAIAAPLFRYEGLALAFAAAGALAVCGERRAAVMIAVGVVGGVVAFSVLLVSLGLDPLPGSVLAKTASVDPEGNVLFRLLVGFFANVIWPAGAVIGTLILAVCFFVAAFPELRRGPAAWILVVVGMSGLAHLAIGQIGWMHRYEPYILASLVGAVLVASTALTSGATIMRAAAMLATLGAGTAYMPALWGSYVWNPRAIHLQQAQMARLAQDYLMVPVAVNDLGRVSWSNPDYVLDIFGLGSAEAREIRFGSAPPTDGWAGKLAAKHGIRAAMIYDFWFATAVGPEWVRVGELRMDPKKGALGAWVVSFYAADPTFAPEMRAALERFAPTLPKDAILTILGAGA